MTVMKRFVDVIFVEPKNRLYVILHKGKFWQLPRMNLTVNAWENKEPYTGSLSDIFVAQGQVIDSKLGDTLSTYELPEQLAGLPATHFLAWWASNDYKWLNEKEVLQFDEKDRIMPASELLEAALKKAQFITQNPNFASDKKKGIQLQLSQEIANDKPKRRGKKEADPKVGSRTPTKKKDAPQTTPNPTKTKAKPSQPKSAQTKKLGTPAEAPKPKKQKPVREGGDVFDNLLDDLMDDLNEELLHKN